MMPKKFLTAFVMPIIPCVLSLHTSMIASAFFRYAVSVKLLACTASGYETEQTEKSPFSSAPNASAARRPVTS